MLRPPVAPVPICPTCGEQGIHANVDDCLKELKSLVAALKKG